MGNASFRVARVHSLLTGLLSWLATHGKTMLSDRQIWWFVLESVEDPVRELVRVTKRTRCGQKHFPDAFSPTGWKRFAHWIRAATASTQQCTICLQIPSRSRQNQVEIGMIELRFSVRDNRLSKTVACRDILALILDHSFARKSRTEEIPCRRPQNCISRMQLEPCGHPQGAAIRAQRRGAKGRASL